MFQIHFFCSHTYVYIALCWSGRLSPETYVKKPLQISLSSSSLWKALSVTVCYLYVAYTCLLCCHYSSVVTCATFPPQSTPECWRNPLKNYTVSSAMLSFAKKSEAVSESCARDLMHAFLKSFCFRVLLCCQLGTQGMWLNSACSKSWGKAALEGRCRKRLWFMFCFWQ